MTTPRTDAEDGSKSAITVGRRRRRADKICRRFFRDAQNWIAESMAEGLLDGVTLIEKAELRKCTKEAFLAAPQSDVSAFFEELVLLVTASPTLIRHRTFCWSRPRSKGVLSSLSYVTYCENVDEFSLEADTLRRADVFPCYCQHNDHCRCYVREAGEEVAHKDYLSNPHLLRLLIQLKSLKRTSDCFCDNESFERCLLDSEERFLLLWHYGCKCTTPNLLERKRKYETLTDDPPKGAVATSISDQNRQDKVKSEENGEKRLQEKAETEPRLNPCEVRKELDDVKIRHEVEGLVEGGVNNDISTQDTCEFKADFRLQHEEELKMKNAEIQELQKRLAKAEERLKRNAAAKKMEKVKISDPCRPSEVAKRLNDLFLRSHQVSSSAEEVEKEKFDESKCTKFILGLFKIVLLQAESHLESMGKTLKDALRLKVSDSPNFQGDKTVKNCVIQLCKVASTQRIGEFFSEILMEAFRSAKRNYPGAFRRQTHVLEEAVFDFIEKCVPVVWDIILQPDCLDLTFVDTRETFDERRHERFYGSDPNSKAILYLVWPLLVDTLAKRVLVKGKVVTGEKIEAVETVL